jgi:hypothetical protein
MSEPSELLSKKYTIKMPDGSVWAVPISVIAEDHAREHAAEFEGGYEESLQEDTLPLFCADDYKIHDWASNNMDWEDVKEHAVLVEPAMRGVDYQEGWVNGDWSITDG